MKASELIAALQALMESSDDDPEVLGQSHGCCGHGHDVRAVEMGKDDEADCIVIRV